MGNGWDKTPLRHQDKSGPVTCTSLSCRLHIYSHFRDRSVVFCFLAEVLSTWNLRFQGDGYKWFLRLIPLGHCFQDHFAKLGSWEIESGRSCLLIISLVWEASLCVGQGLEWLLQRSVGCGFVPVFDSCVVWWCLQPQELLGGVFFYSKIPKSSLIVPFFSGENNQMFNFSGLLVSCLIGK